LKAPGKKWNVDLFDEDMYFRIISAIADLIAATLTVLILLTLCTNVYCRVINEAYHYGGL